MTECPVCAGPVTLPGDVVLSELVDCGECSTELELVSLSPIQLNEAPIAAEDWGE